MAEVKIGIIGGSGLYKIEGVTEIEEVKPATRLASPAMPLCWAILKERELPFFPGMARDIGLAPVSCHRRLIFTL